MPLKFGVEFEEDGNETNFDDILDDVDDDIGDVDLEKVPAAANVIIDPTVDDPGADSEPTNKHLKPIKRFVRVMLSINFDFKGISQMVKLKFHLDLLSSRGCQIY